MSIIKHEKISIDHSNIKNIEDVQLLFALMKITFTIPETDMDLEFIKKGKNKGIFIGETLYYDTEQGKLVMLEDTLAQVKEAQAEAENTTQETNPSVDNLKAV